MPNTQGELLKHLTPQEIRWCGAAGISIEESQSRMIQCIELDNERTKRDIEQMQQHTEQMQQHTEQMQQRTEQRQQRTEQMQQRTAETEGRIQKTDAEIAIHNERMVCLNELTHLQNDAKAVGKEDDVTNVQSVASKMNADKLSVCAPEELQEIKRRREALGGHSSLEGDLQSIQQVFASHGVSDDAAAVITRAKGEAKGKAA